MAVNLIEQKKRQKYLLAGAITIVIITAGFLWFTYMGALNPFSLLFPSAEENPVPNPTPAINFSVFENGLLKKLEPFFQLPAFDGRTGRENPFKK